MQAAFKEKCFHEDFVRSTLASDHENQMNEISHNTNQTMVKNSADLFQLNGNNGHNGRPLQ